MRRATLGEFQHEIGSRMGQGDLVGAAAAAARCRAAWPGAAAGWLLGSIAALMADDKKTALALVEARLAVDGTDVQCLLQKAECLLALNDRSGAIRTAEAAAANAGRLLAALDGVGEFLFHAGDYRGSLALYDRAVAAAPTDPIVRHWHCRRVPPSL